VSLVEQLGARLRGAADELPVSEVAVAADRLRGAVELLAWVRHESTRGIGVSALAFAVEHLEHALQALMVAQEDIATYLAAIGVAGEAVAVAEPSPAARRPPAGIAAPAHAEGEPVTRLRRWWAARVDELTGYGSQPADPDPAPDGAAVDSVELLRRVVAHAGGGDRSRLRLELRRAAAPTGLGLAALAPTALHRLSAEILGHPPGPDDLPALRSAAGSGVGELLPNLDPRVGAVLLARVCRVPAPAPQPDGAHDTAPPHPADSAMAGGVLTGLLLRRTGRDPSTLDRYLVAPVEAAHA
jgi:hypothetical protein